MTTLPWLAETFPTSPLKPLNRIQLKLDRKQDLNVLYQVCVFQADRKNKIAALASDWLRHFRLLLWNLWTEFNWNLTGSKIWTSSTKFVFFGMIEKTRWPPWPLIGWDIFDFSSETAERNSTKLDRKQDLNVLYQVCVFRADWKNKIAALASDWLRHFRLLWNRWTEFNETWQEARSQCPLPSVCFSGRSKKKRWPPWPIRQKGGTLYSGARYVALWASCFSQHFMVSPSTSFFFFILKVYLTSKHKISNHILLMLMYYIVYSTPKETHHLYAFTVVKKFNWW